MLNSDIIANFLGFCNVTIDKICEKDDFIKISLSAAPESQICPCRKNKTSHIHDYRLREVKLPVNSGKTYYLDKWKKVRFYIRKELSDDFLPTVRFTVKFFLKVSLFIKRSDVFRSVYR